MGSVQSVWNNFEVGVFGAINALNENDLLRNVSTFDMGYGSFSYYIGIKPSDMATVAYALLSGS
jgi:hypothetical protein